MPEYTYEEEFGPRPAEPKVYENKPLPCLGVGASNQSVYEASGQQNVVANVQAHLEFFWSDAPLKWSDLTSQKVKDSWLAAGYTEEEYAVEGEKKKWSAIPSGDPTKVVLTERDLKHLKVFQGFKGLLVTGIVDEATYKEMNQSGPYADCPSSLMSLISGQPSPQVGGTFFQKPWVQWTALGLGFTVIGFTVYAFGRSKRGE